MFCDELRAFRQSLGLTSAEMGKRLGISAACVSRYENRGKTKSYVKYTRRLNKEFGTSFPDVTCCNVCGKEVYGKDGVCKSCEANIMPMTKKYESLTVVAKKADEAGLSYGKYVTGLPPKEKIRTHKAPAWLELGKTIKI